MYVITGRYEVYGLVSNSKPDLTFEYKDMVDVYAINDDEGSTMQAIANDIIAEFGEFNPARLDIEHSYEVRHESSIGWGHLDF